MMESFGKSLGGSFKDSGVANSYECNGPGDKFRHDRLKSRLRCVLISTCICFGSGRAVEAADVIVTVDGLSSKKGSVLLELDDSESSWQNHAPSTAVGRVTPTGGKSVTYVFRGVTPGMYGISVIHDENDNGRFDTNFLGIPKEGWGFSNNPEAKRKAKFDEAKFQVGQKDVAITIHIRHVFS